MASTVDETAARASAGLMRAQATWFIDQKTLPRHQSLKLFRRDFSGYLEHLIARIEQLIDARPPDDVPAKVALAGVGEARRRLSVPGAPGLKGEAARVERLARSVMALCDHYDSLTGLVMCLTCDKPIESGDAWVPYDMVCSSSGAVRAGRVHTRCADISRRH